MNRYKFFIFIFILIYHFSHSQNLSGIVNDSLNKPVSNASIIAKPKIENAKIVFSITDTQGKYQLNLAENVTYEIQFSSIGFLTQKIEFTALSEMVNKNIKLQEKIENLEEVIITYKYTPVVVKKDTTTFKVSAFTDGNERKLKDQLKKLPGVEVTSNGEIIFQGRKTSRLLVENKSFFGGGTKLGVENIPADAVEEIDFIDNFSDVSFMKDVNQSEELVINIRLKEDKKNFVFGDLKAGVGLDQNYLLNASLFYFHPDLSISYIGDMNNIGENVLTTEDIVRMGGGYSQYLKNQSKNQNLYQFTQKNSDFVENKTLFSGVNLNHNISKKTETSGHAFFSNNINRTFEIAQMNYLVADVKEQRTQKSTTENLLGIIFFKLNFEPEDKINYQYHFNLDIGEMNWESSIQSESIASSNVLNQNRKTPNYKLSQFIERHQKHSRRKTSTFVVNHSKEKKTPSSQWSSNDIFLQGFIPFTEDDIYFLKQIKESNHQSLDGLFKFYYTLNSKNQFFFNVGMNYHHDKYRTSESQLLSDGTSMNFTNENFGNDLNQYFSDFYSGIEYKLNLNRFVFHPSLFLHTYRMKTFQNQESNILNRIYFEPNIRTEFTLGSNKKLNFQYKLSNQFPKIEQLANGFRVESFNTLFSGNSTLTNEQYHQNNIIFTNNDFQNDFLLYALASYNMKSKSIRNDVIIENINQIITPFLTQDNETNWFLTTSCTKKIKKIQYKFTAMANGIEYFQKINDNYGLNVRNSQNFMLGFRSLFKDLPNFELDYSHGFNQLKGFQNSEFQMSNIVLKADLVFWKYFSYQMAYDYTINHFEGVSNSFDLLNASLVYQNDKKPYLLELKALNLVNTSNKVNNSFSNIMTMSQATFILPRIILLSFQYKI